MERNIRNYVLVETWTSPHDLGFCHPDLPEPMIANRYVSDLDPRPQFAEFRTYYGSPSIGELSIEIEPPFGRDYQYRIEFDSVGIPAGFIERLLRKILNKNPDASVSHSYYSEELNLSGHTIIDKDGKYVDFPDVFPITVESKILSRTAIVGGKGSVPESWLPFVGPIDDFVTPEILIDELSLRACNPDLDTGELSEEIIKLIETFPCLRKSQ